MLKFTDSLQNKILFFSVNFLQHITDVYKNSRFCLQSLRVNFFELCPPPKYFISETKLKSNVNQSVNLKFMIFQIFQIERQNISDYSHLFKRSI